MTENVFLSLGTNLGDRDKNLNEAIQNIKSHPNINVIAVSKTIETKAYGKTDQPDFLNLVVKTETSLTPRELLEFCLSTEDKMKRVRIEKWGPRVIDIDILMFDNLVIKEKDLEIPHYDMHNREFTLLPMNEIAPDTVHPLLNKEMSELFSDLKNRLDQF